MKGSNSVTIEGVHEAEEIVYQYMQPSQLLHYQNLSELFGAKIYVKHENQNMGGSFKIRGGINIMHHLKKEEVPGVITFSTGNHGISVAKSAQLFDLEAIIVVPKNNSPEKNQLIKDAGATLVEAGDNFEEAAAYGQKLQKENQYRFIHAANEPHLIHGVGTEFTEILRQLPDIDVIILPIGGGSELAAAVTVFKALKPSVEIYAVQAEASQAAYLSWKQGEITQAENKTFAGGFATGSGFELTFDIYKNHLTDFILLSEEELMEGIACAFTYTHNVAEGAGGSTLIACRKIADRIEGKNVVLQMSGANESADRYLLALNKYLSAK